MSTVVFFWSAFVFLSFKSHGSEEGSGVSRETQKYSIAQDIDEFNCVDIYKQPAFDNVLLKNHKIQMTPSFLSELKRNEERTRDGNSNIDLKGCPRGMVPIMRTKIYNYTYLKSLSKSHLGSVSLHTQQDPGLHFATLRRIIYDKINGTRAYMEVYNPEVKNDQASVAQMWVESGPPDKINSIQFGWAVNPQLYGDTLSRSIAYWTADSSQKTGCYNMLCAGFVQLNPSIYLGKAYANVSTIGGPYFVATPHIRKDVTSGNWFLYHDYGVVLGYFPKELFTYFDGGATFLQFGGYTRYSADGSSPPMGNGRFPKAFGKNNCFMLQLKVVAEKDQFVDVSVRKMKKFVDNDTCYDVRAWGNLWGSYRQTLSYGGPGGKCGI